MNSSSQNVHFKNVFFFSPFLFEPFLKLHRYIFEEQNVFIGHSAAYHCTWTAVYRGAALGVDRDYNCDLSGERILPLQPFTPQLPAVPTPDR